MRKKTEEQECLKKKKSQAESCEMGTVFLLLPSYNMRVDDVRPFTISFFCKIFFFIAPNFIVYTAHEREMRRRGGAR